MNQKSKQKQEILKGWNLRGMVKGLEMNMNSQEYYEELIKKERPRNSSILIKELRRLINERE